MDDEFILISSVERDGKNIGDFDGSFDSDSFEVKDTFGGHDDSSFLFEVPFIILVNFHGKDEFFVGKIFDDMLVILDGQFIITIVHLLGL